MRKRQKVCLERGSTRGTSTVQTVRQNDKQYIPYNCKKNLYIPGARRTTRAVSLTSLPRGVSGLNSNFPALFLGSLLSYDFIPSHESEPSVSNHTDDIGLKK